MVIAYCPGHSNHIAHRHLDRYSRNDHDSDMVEEGSQHRAYPQHLADVCPNQDQKGNCFARCKIADDWKEIATMIKIKFMSKLALTLAAGCLSIGMLGVDASAQAPMPLITVIIGDNLSFKNVGLGVAAKVLVSDVCGVDERDAKEILELAAINNQKIVAICPRTGAVFHIIP